jgi:nonribosomal peptide synthetase DhbF
MRIVKWTIFHRSGSNQANNIAFAVRAEGAVDVGTLQYALQGLVDAHAALRTVFTVGEGM